MTVPLSTFNSKNMYWKRSWILAIVVSLVFLSCLEYFWRSQGHQPAIVDDMRLWSLQRDKVGTTAHEVVLLGSSRMQADVSTKTLKELLPTYNIINLSTDGSCANAALRDLAEDEKFSGLVLCDMTAQCLLFGDGKILGQHAYPRYYHRVFNLNNKINRIIATTVQKKLTVVDPYLNLQKILGLVLTKRELRQPNYLTTDEDRTRSADYTKTNLGLHTAKRIENIKVFYQKLYPSIKKDLFHDNVKSLENAVKRIQMRGGKVVFIRFPVSGEHWDIDEKYFPKEIYWDLFSHITNAETIHFKDVKFLSNFDCPDTSHLDVRDKPEFTRQLYLKLIKKGVL